MTAIPRMVKPPPRAGRLLAAALGVLTVAPAAAGDLPPVRLPAGFHLERFAGGLGAPRMLALDPAGAVLVSIPVEGRVLALADPQRRGRAGDIVTVARGLDLPHGLAVRDGHLYVAETGRVIRFRYDAASRRASDPTVVVGNLPAGEHHWSRSVAFGPDGGLYVAVGSSCDVCREADRRRATIVRYRADGTGERLFATGLRNPVGLAFHPVTRALWTTINERDWRGGGAPPDYVTEVRDGAAYGWPDCYAEQRRFRPDPELAAPGSCGRLTLPTFELPAHSAPLGLTFHTGRGWPTAYRNSLFVALHGSRAGLPAAGYKIVRADLARGTVEDFATGWRQGDRIWGRPVDVLEAPDGALLVSDDHGRAVYRIVYRP